MDLKQNSGSFKFLSADWDKAVILMKNLHLQGLSGTLNYHIGRLRIVCNDEFDFKEVTRAFKEENLIPKK